MGQLPLLVDVGINEKSQFMDGLLGLTGQSASKGDDVLVDVVNFVSDPVDGVDSSC